MKEKYEKAEIEIIQFEVEDVITTSNENNNNKYIETPEHEF